jgi:hypothetical protein
MSVRREHFELGVVFLGLSRNTVRRLVKFPEPIVWWVLWLSMVLLGMSMRNGMNQERDPLIRIAYHINCGGGVQRQLAFFEASCSVIGQLED